MMSRWCDQLIHDTGHSDRPNGPLCGRSVVWNPCRGNHLGQRSCASAPTGRTYGRKRSDQSAAKHLARRGPSTYGECRSRQDFSEGMLIMRWMAFGSALLAAAVVQAPVAQATVLIFATPLSGPAEAPPNSSLGTGEAIVTIDNVLHTMDVQVTFSGLTGTTTASHIHCCTLLPGTGTAGIATERPTFSTFPLGVMSGT